MLRSRVPYDRAGMVPKATALSLISRAVSQPSPRQCSSTINGPIGRSLSDSIDDSSTPGSLIYGRALAYIISPPSTNLVVALNKRAALAGTESFRAGGDLGPGKFLPLLIVVLVVTHNATSRDNSTTRGRAIFSLYSGVIAVILGGSTLGP